MAEAILNGMAKGRFRAFSAGSAPATAPNPFALETLARQHLPIESLRSKGWEEFATDTAPVMDLVITVCDDAAGEACPVWPGGPTTAHWGVEDPSRFPGTDGDKQRKFGEVASILRRRIELLVDLPVATMERSDLEQKIREIGRV